MSHLLQHTLYRIGLLGWMFVALHSFAQPRFKIRNYTASDGLQLPAVDKLVQDGQGFLWVNQMHILSRFDGYEFKVYRHDPDDSLMQLGPQFIGPPIIDEYGELWICGLVHSWQNRSLLKYDRLNDAFIPFKPEINGRVICLSVDSSQSGVWMGELGSGLYHYDIENKQTLHYLNPNRKGRDDRRSNVIIGLKSSGSILYSFTEWGIWAFDKAKGRFFRPRIAPTDTALLYNTTIRPFQRTGWYLSIEARKVIRLDDNLKITESFKLPDEYDKRQFQKSLGTFDQNDIFWFVGDRGLYRYDYKLGALEFHEEDFGWSNGEIVDRENNVWLFGWDLGLRKVIRPELSFVEHKIDDPKFLGAKLSFRKLGNTEAVIALGIGNQNFDNAIWTGKIDNGEISLDELHFENKEFGRSNMIKSWPGLDYFWVATWGRGVIGFPYDKAGGALSPKGVVHLQYREGSRYTLPSDFAWAVFEDNDYLWIGTVDGLTRVNRGLLYGSEGSVKNYRHQEGDTTSLSANYVRHIFPEGDGRFWVATVAGLDLFENGKFRRVLKNIQVEELYRDRRGDLYVGTVIGLFRGQKTKDRYRFDKITDRPALPSAEDKDGNLWWIDGRDITVFNAERSHRVTIVDPTGRDLVSLGESSDGRMTVSSKGAGSLITFDPASFQRTEFQPVPLLTKLKVNNKEVGVRQADDSDVSISQNITMLNEVTLDYRHNSFSVEFSAMEITAPECNLYQYKLEGYDKEWVKTDARNRSATYTSLPEGTYTFRVKASNHQGVWSDKEQSMRVVILPPPWRTWWAYAGYSLLAAALLVGARRSIVQRERLKASLQLEKVEREREHFELEKAKEVDRVKTSFFTNISHEFRTPLTLIKGPVDTLLDRYKDDPEVVTRLKLVQRNSDLLLKLINQLLDLAKLESGTLKVEKTDGEVLSFVRGVAGSFESMARQKGIDLKIETAEGSLPARFDKDKVETVLINLINNAIKFTPQGGKIVVAATFGELTAKAPRREGLTLSVQDTGIGIPTEHQSKIFERFHQVSEAHKEVGTGIGLALVKELITLMGGEISVQSEPGKGTEFTVSLPIEAVVGSPLSVVGGSQANADGLAGNDEYSPTTDHRPLTTPISLSSSGQADHRSPTTDDDRPQVLVVEDNADLRAFIIDSLGPEFQFHQAENGKQGLQIATEHIPDMIISDVMMPEMDGMEMTRRIKEDIKTSHIPLILLTAKSGEDSKLEGLSKGADDYLTKPFNKQELLLKVRNGTARMQKIREKMKAEVLSTAPMVEVLSADEQFLNKVKETILQRMSDEQLSVESLADDMGMSRVQLYRKVSALTGMAVNELIRKLRLQRAAQLLGQNWGPVSQVAYEVGFSNLSYFSKVFKEEFGALPSEYEKI